MPGCVLDSGTHNQGAQSINHLRICSLKFWTIRLLLVGLTLTGLVSCTSAQAPESPEVTDTLEPITLTPEVSRTLSDDSTATPQPTGFAPVTANRDWTPIERDFDGVTMVLVPAGCFSMGSTEINSNEEPEHEQCFEQPFWIDKTEVTNAQFVRLNGIAAKESESIGDDFPRDSVNGLEAATFCTLRGVRLVTEREWEYAASGPDNLRYPWGTEWNPDIVVWEENADGGTHIAGSVTNGASWVGALHMSGNLWEWTSSIGSDYPYNADDGREVPFNVRSRRVMRGGSWSNQPELLTTSFRLTFLPDFSDMYTGFRCARAYE